MNATDARVIHLKMLQHLDGEVFERLAESAGGNERLRLSKLRRKYEAAKSEEEREGIEYRGEEEQAYLEEMKVLAPLLAAVGLYSAVEQRRSRIAEIASRQKLDLHKVAAFKTALVRLGIAAKEVAGWRDMEELRLIANNVKHSGLVVGARLSQEYPTYKAGTPLKLADTGLGRFTDSAKGFIKDLSSRWIAAVRSGSV